MKNVIIALLVVICISCSEKDPEPTVSFTSSLGSEGKVQFQLSTANADTYLWDFGDNTTSTERFPVHTYAKNGNFNVTVSAKGKGGQKVSTGNVVINNVTGSVMFWMQFAERSVDIYLDGKYIGYIDGYYKDGAPECGAKAAVTWPGLSEGAHIFKGQERNTSTPKIWNNSFQIVGGTCSKMRLN